MKKQLTAVLLIFALLLTMSGCSVAHAVQKLDAAEDRVEAKLDAAEDKLEASLRNNGSPAPAAASKEAVPAPTPVETQPAPENTQKLTEEQALEIALKHLDFMILDILVLQASFVLSYMLHHDWKNPFAESLYSNMSLFLMLCDLLVIFFTEPFRNILKRGYYREMEALVQQALFIELFAVMFLFMQKA